MEVYFIDVSETGRNVIHGFGCTHSHPGDREFLGSFNHVAEAVKKSLSRVRKVSVCRDCCPCFDASPS